MSIDLWIFWIFFGTFTLVGAFLVLDALGVAARELTERLSNKEKPQKPQKRVELPRARVIQR